MTMVLESMSPATVLGYRDVPVVYGCWLEQDNGTVGPNPAARARFADATTTLHFIDAVRRGATWRTIQRIPTLRRAQCWCQVRRPKGFAFACTLSRRYDAAQSWLATPGQVRHRK